MATKEDVDLKFNNDAGYFDISIADNGDFELTDALDTSLLMTFYTEQRADESEIKSPENRGGWWGNLFSDEEGFQVGSKLWLLNQSTNSQNTLNKAIAYATNAFSWLTRYSYADEVNVTGTQSLTNLTVTVDVIKYNNVITQKVFDLWQNTFDLASN